MTDHQSSPDIDDVVAELVEEANLDYRPHTLTTGFTRILNAYAARSSAGIARVAVKPMQLSDGRTDYFVSIKAGDREVTPHVFREEYKAAYHVALYDWLLNGSGEEPDVVEFGPDDWPARTLDPAQGTGVPPSLPKGWTQQHAAKAAWMISTLAITPTDEWRSKSELYDTMAEFRALAVTSTERQGK